MPSTRTPDLASRPATRSQVAASGAGVEHGACREHVDTESRGAEQRMFSVGHPGPPGIVDHDRALTQHVPAAVGPDLERRALVDTHTQQLRALEHGAQEPVVPLAAY